MSGFSDLNGLWTGSYGYSEPGKPSVAFTAWLDDQASAIGGTIMEPNTFAATPAEELSATISGARSDLELAFTKLYDAGQGTHDTPIQYAGKINNDFTWIVGRWRVPGWFEWSGPFEMSRQSGSFEQAERERKAELVE